ncbi:hypothetical protein KY290_033573 [Solanum tuberosum]|uniref:TNP2-like transposon protein n=1 Tax=Solanum tuberosum TaxID=4113 RepID=A0ABQ7U0Z2_SOLTU|nr:hypothetical protein KY285_032831 [Solanum tuberosum]KAH0740530.1 hypothetical protein KY290_033573 [Solanum tuberosum]
MSVTFLQVLLRRDDNSSLPASQCLLVMKNEKSMSLEKNYIQGFPSIDKNTLVLQKENAQTKSPGSTDQVISSNPRKVKRVRGSNKCKEVASLEAGTKLKVTFYNNRTVGTNSNLFSRNLGKIIRDCNMCPLGVSSCSDIKQLKFDHMWAAVTAQIKEILKVEPSLPSIEIVEKCCGPQTHSHVFGFGGGVKAKDMRGGTFSKTELLSELCSTQEENKSLNEKNKSFNDRLSTLEDEMNEIRKRKEFIAAKQSHNPHTTSPVSIE